MFVKEAIERADKLINNEYDIDEKYHWCDVVGAELSAIRNDFKRVDLSLYNDNTYLLPEDCDISSVEKIIAAGQEIPKRDMRTNGLYMSYAAGAAAIIVEFGSRTDRLCDTITIVYKPVYHPIRTAKEADVTAVLTAGADTISGDTITTTPTVPFIAGDTINVTADGKTAEASILIRQVVMPDDHDYKNLKCVLTCGTGELAAVGYGSKTIDIERVITDRTLCPPPYDEMYIDYIAAQICFYQRKNDIYQQHIARYNARMAEYKLYLKDTEAVNDHTQFVNWWKL